MTEKQIERVRLKISKFKKALAADKKQWGGDYHDGSGLRYAPPGLYLKINDFKGAMNYFRWFAKNFPDDCCYGEFLLEWSFTYFKLGKFEEAWQNAKKAYFSNTRVLNKFFGKELTMVDETISSFEITWAESLVLAYSAEQNDWKEYAEWLESLLTTEPFLSLSAEYLDIQKQIKATSDFDKRSELLDKSSVLEES